MLAPGAYISHPSPVAFERATVTEDQCIFCLKRRKKKNENLGAHMSMKHAGYGLKNREARRWKEKLRN